MNAPTSLAPDAGFLPARGLAHPVAQTAFGVFGRRLPTVAVEARCVETLDGDFLSLEVAVPDDGISPRGFLVLVHGLEGSSRSGYMISMLARCRAAGLAGIAMNLRGCGERPNRLARGYSAGFTDDIRLVVETACALWPGIPGAIAGFSLGANLALKYLGELGAAAPDAIRGGVAVSCPFDLSACADHIDAPASWWMRAHFLRPMREKALAKAARFPSEVDAERIARVTTIRGIDDAFTAPLHGFRDAEEYYRRSSARGYLAGIARPTLLVSALDDPLIPGRIVPREIIAANPALRLVATERGGHVGFVAGSILRPAFWAEERAMAFIREVLGT